MEENKKWYKNKKIIATLIVCTFVIIVVISILLTLSSSNNTTSSNANKESNTKNEVTIKYDKSKPYLTEEQINKMYSNPKSYIGENVKIIGKVFSVEKYDYGYALQIFRDIQNLEQNTVVYYYSTSPIEIKEDDYIAIDGYVSDIFKGQNAYGGVVTAPLIITYGVEKSSYMEACSPTIKSVEVNQTQTQHGCTITLSKVEFAKNETRVYVTVTNNSSYEFSVYTYSAKATQAGKQYEYESNYEADYEELQTDLLAGITSSGVITFPAMNQADFNFIIEGSSDNWQLRFNPYQFNIKVQ